MESKTETAGPRPRRVLCLWLPRFAAERILGERAGPETPPEPERPFAAWAGAGNRLAIVAANAAAEAAGIHAGQALADARALCPTLATAPTDPAADAQALGRLAAWCRRFAPWTATVADLGDGTEIPGGAGIWIEATGAAHLLGGEAALMDTAGKAFARAGFTARAGLAGTPGAAYALARFAPDGDGGGAVARPGAEASALSPLPVAALRLGRATVEALDGVGLRRVGDLLPLAAGAGRAMLARRFPPELLERLDAALGRRFEPIGPGRERPRLVARLDLPEPTHGAEAVAQICGRLVGELAGRLAAQGLGARRFTFTAFGSDGRARAAEIGTARPTAAARTLAHLFALRLEGFDAGPGADAFSLEARATAPLPVRQGRLPRTDERAHDAPEPDSGDGLAPLIDRLHGRFGRARVGRLALRPEHLPERAQAFAGAEGNGRHPSSPAGIIPGPGPARPVRLLDRPEALEPLSEATLGPPARFRWRGTEHRVARAEGPERIALDWWTLPGWQASPCAPAQPPGLGAAIRDYYVIETAAGMRLWVYRAGPPRADAPARWFVHGFFP